MVRLADFPQASEMRSLAHALEHVAVQIYHVFLHTFRFDFRESRVHVANAFFDAAIVGNSEEMFVFFAKPVVIVEALFEFRRDANHVPVVGQLFGCVRVQPERSPAQLVDGH